MDIFMQHDVQELSRVVRQLLYSVLCVGSEECGVISEGLIF